ncbi:MAG: hypothetical protein MRQ07_05520 [Candidatus Midichloria sp.]|nr:hypothetical protein [Candidatus Midichloria sp.]
MIGVAQKLKIGDFELLLPQNYNYFQDRTYLLECLKSNLKIGIKQKGTIAVVGTNELGWHAGFINQDDDRKFTWIHSCMK